MRAYSIRVSDSVVSVYRRKLNLGGMYVEIWRAGPVTGLSPADISLAESRANAMHLKALSERGVA